MLVRNLTEKSDYYTSNVWHICGTYHALSDLNTLIDVGRDPVIMESLETIRCGLGKRPVEQVILTHSHFDHAGMLPKIREKYNPHIYAHPLSRNDETTPLADRQKIQIGEQECMVVYAPGHSEDSLCIVCEEEHLLFSGDVPLRIYSHDGEFSTQFLDAYELFVSVGIQTIYPGHGDQITCNVPHLMEESLKNIRKSRIV
ncbi:MAG TPA: MBL fold metallo-hydrolase [Methanospirillum sp.]|uniref:MBL fold metallo-hydrolase n=1 Tax=Methanospirillum sp. TaxID=45200 RepID=UPI002C152F30|nr:MBL fold metallo-hydrolase [Methanospirillum sp.]HOJ96043.1 MBL fold metallo-hydrolase [Methanospirillum sp.]HPP77082.1 MBL fold metallo-hydrolase [Methanospirillum sp.]